MNSIKSATLKKSVEVGHRTGQKVAIRVSNICTHFANRLCTPKCDTLRLLQKAEFDIDRLVQLRTDLEPPQRTLLQNLKKSTVAVYSCKAVLEKKVVQYAQNLTSSLKGYESRLLDFEHVATELGMINDFFNKIYFEVRYGDYLNSSAGKVELEKFPFQPCSTSDFNDPDELVKAGEFAFLSQRLIEDLTSLEFDFDRLANGLRDDTQCYSAVERAILAYKTKYFQSLNRTSGDYQLSQYAADLQKMKDQRDKAMAIEALDEGITDESEAVSQPFEEYDILEDEIYMSDGTSRTTTEEGPTESVPDGIISTTPSEIEKEGHAFVVEKT